MSVIRPFRAVRPKKEYCRDVAALPYDVMNSEEAREAVKGKPLSFLHVDKAEVDLPKDIDIYDDRVYRKARENLDSLIEKCFITDEKPSLYIYRQIMDGRTQTGIVGLASVDDYLDNVIKKHEHTRADKELDRIRHVDTCDANTGLIFLAHRRNDEIERIKKKYLAKEPYCDFVSDEGVRNTVFVISDQNDIDCVVSAMGDVESLYIADGHHRAASAVKVAQKRREEKGKYDPDDRFNFFEAVFFDADELTVMDYNRVIRDLNGMTVKELLKKIGEVCETKKADKAPYRPNKKHEVGMLLDGVWYKLVFKNGTFDEKDPVDSLDVSILQKNIIAPIFGIEDPRKDERIDFVGGIRGLEELERRCEDDMKVAFSMYPTSLVELMNIADAGKVMPPKSTWFEPKLMSGLFIHRLS